MLLQGNIELNIPFELKLPGSEFMCSIQIKEIFYK